MINRGIVVSAAAAIAASLLVAPTHAATDTAGPSRVVLRDPRGDVWSIAEGENEQYHLAARTPTADVVRAVVAHRHHRVVIRLRFADLRRKDGQAYFATIVTPRRYMAVFVNAGPGAWRGQHRLLNEQFGRIRCPRLSHHIRYDRDRVAVKVPRRCLGRPAWIRADLVNFMARGKTEQTFRQLTDNPHNDRPQGHLTRRLYRSR